MPFCLTALGRLAATSGRCTSCSCYVNTARRAVSGYAAAGNGHFAITVPRKDNDVVIQVYGANTGVGKTVVGTGLCSAALRATLHTSYIKPVQTGAETDADAVARIIGPDARAALQAATLFSFTSPTSPHLAALEDNRVVSDAEVLQALVAQLGKSISTSSSQQGSFSLIETSGGVLSPGPSGTLQADLFRPLRLPVLLVGDPHLGGIGTTLSVLESLRIRGYTVAGVAFMGAGSGPEVAQPDEDLKFACGNADAVEREVATLGIPVFRIGGSLPHPDAPLHAWHAASARDFDEVVAALRAQWRRELADALTHTARACRRLWWPFTQHATLPRDGVTNVDSAYGNYFHSLESAAGAAAAEEDGAQSNNAAAAAARMSGRILPLHDAPASWWTQGLGHGNPELGLAVAEAAGRYGHLLFPGTTHAPALRLAEELVERGPGAGWAARAFFTDDGSTGMEVAIKMALRRFALDRWGADGAPPNFKLEVIAQAGCYHGDTLGVMDVAEPSVFNARQHPWYAPRGLFLEPPTLAWRGGRYALRASPAAAAALAAAGAPPALPVFADRAAAFDLEARLSTTEGAALARAYEAAAHAAIEAHEAAAAAPDGARVVLGALVIEPLLLGAGGMHLADPLWQRALVDAARARALPVVYDEVFSGLWRLGVESCRAALRRDPDVAVYAKLLTGGLLPLCATLAAERVFDAFAGDSKAAALLHGHSYTAHPAGCAAALHALAAYKRGPHYRGGAGGGSGSGGGGSSSSSGGGSGGGASGAHMADQWDDSGAVRALSLLPNIARAVSLGTVLAIEIQSDTGGGGGYDAGAGAVAAAALRERGVLARPLGNVIYCMVTPDTPREECARLLAVYKEVLESLQ